jgi:hypothetical protein
MNICVCNINTYLCEYHKKRCDKEKEVTFIEASLEDKVDYLKIAIDDLRDKFEQLEYAVRTNYYNG